MRRLALALAFPLAVTAAVFGSACSEKAADDRTLQALEAERKKNGEEDPNARLANLAAGRQHTSEKTVSLNLPEKRAGDVVVRPTQARITRSLSGGKIALTTEERFVLVTVTVRAERGGDALNLENARLTDTANNSWPIASDAQRLVERQRALRAVEEGAAPAVPPTVPAPAPDDDEELTPEQQKTRAEEAEKLALEEAEKRRQEQAEKIAGPKTSEIVLVFEIPNDVKEHNLSLNLENATFKLFQQ